ncbi:hypothetical protein ABFA07_003655 [Porites harrisoni]
MASHYSASRDDSSEKVSLMNEDDSPSSSPTRVNRKSLVILFGVTVVAVAFVISAVIVSIYSGKGGPFSNKVARSSDRFTFDDIFSGKFSPAGYSCQWVSDDEYITSKPEGLVLINLTKNKSDILLTQDDKDYFGISSHWFSPDRQYILFTKQYKQQYRYSFWAEYHVLDMAKKTTTQLKAGIEGEDPTKIQYATWGEKSNALVFVYANDIFYMESPSSSVVQLTHSGVEHKIFNGVPDWVYQEEVLNSDHALYFSPDGQFLAYIQFNDSKVNWYQFPWYGDRKNAYTTIRKIAYPKPGYSNPTVKVFVIDLKNNKRVQLPEPSSFKDIDHYVVNVGWVSEKAVSVNWLNRDQNEAILHICEQQSIHFMCKENSKLTVKGGWVDDKYTTPKASKDGSYYITPWPFPQGSEGDFIHIAKMRMNPKEGERQTPEALTSGPWEVLKILAHDDMNEIVYFSATKESPTESHVYSVHIRTTELKCLSCNLPTLNPGNKCSYYGASFSLKGSWYTLHCKGPDIPEVTLRSTQKDPEVVVPLQYNRDLMDRLDGVKLPGIKTYTVENGDYDLYVKEYRPPGFTEDKKYGVLFSVYGGPSSQKVVDAYGYGFETGYLVSNFDLIVVNVDARGTCCRGERFKHEVYKQIGKAEAEDTIAVARHIANKKYVDENKLAIWGWSYGGFLTSYILGQKSDVFKVGMAVAPVTDWRYYDSIYTERYMLTPQKNFGGYEVSSVLPLAPNFSNDSFLLVHGTGDDNVHFQNTAQLVAALTKAGVKYQVQFYPDKNHGLRGGGTSDHLYHLLTRFLLEKLSISS